MATTISLQSVLVLLQLVVGLLTNSPHNPQTIDLASKAVILAEQALAIDTAASTAAIVTITPTSTDLTIATSFPPLAIGGAPIDIPVPIATPTSVPPILPPPLPFVPPSCTLTGTSDSTSTSSEFTHVYFTWTLAGMPTSTPGTISPLGGYNGDKPFYGRSFDININGETSTPDTFPRIYAWKATFRETTCFAFFGTRVPCADDKLPNGTILHDSYCPAGGVGITLLVSTSTPPQGWNGQ